jgi:hypothetical protein
MDVVYVCRPGNRNEELRYSLRSLVNVPHERVWIAGHMPTFVRGAEHIPVRFARSNHAHTSASLRAACSHAEVSETFVLMNDDFFVIRPMAEIPVLHRGPIEDVAAEYVRRGGMTYVASMRKAASWLAAQGCEPVLSYELHVPLPVVKAKMAEVLGLGVPGLESHKRTVYGNLGGIGGERSEDYKVIGQEWSKAWPFISTMDHTFARDEVGRYIRARFPEPSPYEVI